MVKYLVLNYLVILLDVNGFGNENYKLIDIYMKLFLSFVLGELIKRWGRVFFLLGFFVFSLLVGLFF